jgi:putative flippase GtrA
VRADARRPLLAAPGRPSPVERVLGLLHDRRVQFLIVGAINTVVCLGCFFLLHLALPRAPYLVVLLASYAISSVPAFVMHRRFVYQVRGGVALDLVRFLVVTSGGLGLNAVVLFMLVELAHAPVLLGQLLATCMTVVLSYVAHGAFSFRRVPVAEADASTTPAA